MSIADSMFQPPDSLLTSCFAPKDSHEKCICVACEIVSGRCGL
ncbi:unnamed protein product [Musa acuminata var. zebrina]